MAGVGEDFKLSSGTWVSVGVLRPDFVAACSPLIFDAVIAGLDKNYIAALVWPSPTSVEQYLAEAGGDLGQAIANFRTDLIAKAQKFNAAEPGSSRRVKRVHVMMDPPSIDAGEITDKGYVNQRKVLERRADLVKALYTDPLPDNVLQI